MADTQHPRDQQLGEFHRLLNARQEARELVQRQGKGKKVAFSEISKIAQKHYVEPTRLLAELAIISDCDVDIASGYVICA